MTEYLYIIVIFITIIYSTVISVLYFREINDKNNYQKQKIYDLNTREDEINKKEQKLVEIEKCNRDLTKLKTLQDSITKILNNQTNNK
jgi:hypothetical protein